MRFIKPGKVNGWSVRHLQVTEAPATRPKGCGMDEVAPGTYPALFDPFGEINMIASPVLIDDQREAVKDAAGHILVGGLGLGLVVGMLADVEDVTAITVVEINRDVISLVWDAYQNIEKARVVIGDAKQPQRLLEHQVIKEQLEFFGPFSRVWLDLWPTDESSTVSERWQAIKNWSSVCDWVGVSAMLRKQEQWAV